ALEAFFDFLFDFLGKRGPLCKRIHENCFCLGLEGLVQGFHERLLAALVDYFFNFDGHYLPPCNPIGSESSTSTHVQNSSPPSASISNSMACRGLGMGSPDCCISSRCNPMASVTSRRVPLMVLAAATHPGKSGTSAL